MIKAINDRIIIQMVEAEPTKVGALILPKEQHFELGKVVSTGDKVTTVQEGDHVFIRQHGGFPLEYKDAPYRSIRIDDVLGLAEGM